MLLSTPLFLLFFFNDLNSADDVLVEHQFNAVMVQNGLKIEVEGSGPDAYVVEVNGDRIPADRTRWLQGMLQILDENGGVLVSMPLISSSAGPGCCELVTPRNAGLTKAKQRLGRLPWNPNGPGRTTATQQ